MVANAFQAYHNNQNIIIFASGVSNSQEKDENEFNRELKLIDSTLSKHPDKLFVYFSTCSIYDPLAAETPYVKHKLKMEDYIKKHAKHYLILRVSQILGRSKNRTLVNFLLDKISTGEHFDVWKNSNRNLISITDVLNISNKLIEDKEHHNQIYHIANPVYIAMPDLVNIFEQILQKTANCTYLDKGKPYAPIPFDISSIVDALHIQFDDQYYYKNIQNFVNLSQRTKSETKFSQD